MKRCRSKYEQKPGQITRGESEGAKLYAEALKELPPLIARLKAQGRIKIEPPLPEGRADYIRKHLNKYGRSNKAASRNGADGVV